MFKPSHWPSQFKLWLCSRAQPSFAKAYRAKIAKAKRRHGKVNREAAEAFVKAGLDEAAAFNAVTAIAKGQITNVTINY